MRACAESHSRRSCAWRHRLGAAALVLASLGAPSLAYASGVDPATATPVQREQAQARFVRGRQLFDQKAYEDALREFRASHDIVASPNSLLYAGRALRELGRVVEAYVELGRAAVEAREQAPVDGRYNKASEAAANEREVLKKKLGFAIVRIDHAEEGTRLVVAKEEIRRGGWNEPVPMLPGTTEVRAETPGRAPVSASVTVSAGQQKDVVLDVAAGAPIAPEAAPVVVAPAPAKGATSLRPYAYVAGGVGVVGVATFAIFGLMAKGTHDDLAKRCPNGACAEDPSSDVSSGKSQQTISNVGLAVGLVGLAAGATLFFLEPKRDTKAASSPTVSPYVSAGVGPLAIGARGAF